MKRWLLKGLPRRDCAQNGAAHSGPMFNALEILRLPRESIAETHGAKVRKRSIHAAVKDSQHLCILG